MKEQVALIVLVAWSQLYATSALLGGNVQTVINRKLKDVYLLANVSGTTLAKCADRCVYENDCLSVSFTRETGRCEMYWINGTLASTTVVENGVIFIDIGHWTRERTGACAEKPCGLYKRCMQDKLSYQCTYSSFGCPDYVPEYENQVVYFTTEGPKEPVAHQVNVGCKTPYVSLWITPHVRYIQTCMANGTWDGVSGPCFRVIELCTFFFFQNHNSITMLTVSSTTMSPGISNIAPMDVILTASVGWTAATHDDKQYLELTLDDTYWIGGVSTKGGPNGDWVTSFRVAYAYDFCHDYIYYTERPPNDAIKIFPGNTDNETVVDTIFEPPFLAKCVKIEPVTFHLRVAMRLDVRGCTDTRIYDHNDYLNYIKSQPIYRV